MTLSEVIITVTKLIIMLHYNFKGLHFHPWIGKNYHNSKYNKLLLFGESHYGEKKDDCNSLTTEVVRNFLENPKDFKSPFFRKIGFILNPEDCNEPWQNVAFANGIQICLSDVKSQPNKKEIEGVAPAFEKLVNYLKPKKVLILSKRMWERWMPKENWETKPHKYLKATGKQSQIWKYKYNGGECLCMGIYHPSSRGFSSISWKPLVDKFLNQF